MQRPPLHSRSTSGTVLWFAALAIIWQAVPVPDAWKVLPPLEATFLVQGWKASAPMEAPLEAVTGVAPPALPSEDAEDEEEDRSLADAQALALKDPRSAPPGAQLEADPSRPPAHGSDGMAERKDVGNGTTDGTGPFAVLEPVAAPDSGTLSGPFPVAGSKRSSSLLASLERPQPLEQGCINLHPDGCHRWALEPFYEALGRTSRREPGAITRVLHLGDSIIASDYISSTVRRRLQRVLGDAGHGFLLAAKPWRWYDHRGVTHRVSSGWSVHSVVSPRFRDRRFGLGGVGFQTVEAGLTAEYGTATSGRLGRSVARFELYYQVQPGGGSIDLRVGKQVLGRLSTQGDQVAAGFYPISVIDGPATLTLRTVGDGPVRLYGVTLEREVPGVVYDSVGVVGGSMHALKKINVEHWTEQLRHRAPDLVVFSFGANESLTYAQAGPTMMREYERQQAAILKRIRIALPDAALLVMGPLDAAERVDDGLRTRPAIPKLVEAQRRAALANGAAFWDTFAVMGGEGSMARWVKNRVGSSDLVHPSWGGAVFLGNELSRSMLSGFEAHQERLARTMPWTPPSQSAGIPASPKNLESSVPAPQAARMPARTVRPTRIQDPLYAGRARAARQSQP